MTETIRAGMASSDLYFVPNQVDMTQKQKHRKKKQMDFGSVALDLATLPIVFMRRLVLSECQTPHLTSIL